MASMAWMDGGVHAVWGAAHVNVKAQALLNGAAWVREKHGAPAFERVLALCRPEVRERCATAIAINWHPLD